MLDFNAVRADIDGYEAAIKAESDPARKALLWQALADSFKHMGEWIDAQATSMRERVVRDMRNKISEG